MALPIVSVNATVTTAPPPELLQETGAIISQGATTVTTGQTILLVQQSSLTPYLSTVLSLASLSYSGGTVTATASAAINGRNVGDKFATTIAGTTPAAYSGTYAATVTGTNTFTYALTTGNPGAETVPGNYTPAGQTELIAQVADFFTQGTSQSVYLLELGPGDQTTGPAALSNYIVANPNAFYIYLVPKGWDASSGLLALCAQFETPESKTYFFVTTTASTYTAYPATMKCIVALVDSPTKPITEFSHAADFQHALNYNPSSANRMTPFSFSYLYDVTAYPTQGNQAQLLTLKNANINYVGTGAEGGVSNTILFWGKTLDGQDFSWWYSADWIQLNSDLNIANAIITGSQNSINPLVYDQDGINRLQDVTVNTVGQAISYGLATGTVARTTLDPVTFAQNLDDGVYAGMNVVNAIPFSTYVSANPSDYAIGKYAGLSVVYIPQNGFQQIIFNVNITNLLSQ